MTGWLSAIERLRQHRQQSRPALGEQAADRCKSLRSLEIAIGRIGKPDVKRLAQFSGQSKSVFSIDKGVKWAGQLIRLRSFDGGIDIDSRYFAIVLRATFIPC